jgi:hypothetical protein
MQTHSCELIPIREDAGMSYAGRWCVNEAEANGVGFTNGSAEQCTHAKHRQLREKGSHSVRGFAAKGWRADQR